MAPERDKELPLGGMLAGSIWFGVIPAVAFSEVYGSEVAWLYLLFVGVPCGCWAALPRRKPPRPLHRASQAELEEEGAEEAEEPTPLPGSLVQEITGVTEPHPSKADVLVDCECGEVLSAPIETVPTGVICPSCGVLFPVSLLEFDLSDPYHAELSLDVAGAFGKTLEDQSHRHAGVAFQPVSRLPYPREMIRAALTALIEFDEGRVQSPFLENHRQNSHILLSPTFWADFIDAAKKCLYALDEFFLDVSADMLPTDPEGNARVALELKMRVRRSATNRDPLPE